MDVLKINACPNDKIRRMRLNVAMPTMFKANKARIIGYLAFKVDKPLELQSS